MRFEAFNYVECSIPAGMTIAEYRRPAVPPEHHRHQRIPRLLKRRT